MRIDVEACIGCEVCIPYCPVGAIHKDGENAAIDLEDCVECCTCLEVEVCPVDAIYQQEMEYPRTIRPHFSNPTEVCEETGIGGRGTDECKTNDVKGLIGKGEVAFAIEPGRPLIGTSLREAEKFTKALSDLDLDYEEDNPLVSLVKDWDTGEFKDEVKDERVLSIIIEFKTSLENVDRVFKVLRDLDKQVDTVFSVGVYGMAGEVPSALEEGGLNFRPNAKVNVGLGRPLSKK